MSAGAHMMCGDARSFFALPPKMNGDWLPWSEGVNGNRARQYVMAWRRVHQIFRNVGATNVARVWRPNVIYAGVHAASASVSG
jgi:beta-mannanase